METQSTYMRFHKLKYFESLASFRCLSYFQNVAKRKLKKLYGWWWCSELNYLIELFHWNSPSSYYCVSGAVVRRCSVKKVFLEISQNSQKSRLFFNKVARLRPATLLKKSLWHRCFSVNFAKFLRTAFFAEHLRWLLLVSGNSCGIIFNWPRAILLYHKFQW